MTPPPSLDPVADAPERLPPARGLSGRAGLVAAGALLVLAIVGSLASFLVHERRQALDELADRQALLARMALDGVLRQVAGASQALATLDGAIAAAAPDAAALQPLLAPTLGALPFVRSLALVADDGRIVASSDGTDRGRRLPPAALPDWPAPGREQLGALLPLRRLGDLDRAGPDGPDAHAAADGPRPHAAAGGAGPHGGAPAPVPAGVSALPLWRGLAAQDAGHRLALVALLNPDAFAGLQHSTLAGDSGVAALLTYDGRLIAATEGLAAAPGTSYARLPPYASFLPRWDAGTWAGDGLRPGRQRAAFRAASALPLVMLVEQDETVALAAWRAMALRHTGLGLLAVALVLALTWAAQRSLGAREQALRALASAQQAAARRERELSVTVRSLQELIFRTDAVGRITYVSERWSAVVGEAPSRAIGRPLLDWIDSAQHAAVQALFDPAAGPAARQQAVTIVDPQGTRRHYALAVMPLQQGGRTVGHAGSAVDVTEREEARQRLRAQLDFTELLLDLSPLPVAVQDRDGRYQIVNGAWEAFTGVRRGDVCVVAGGAGGAAVPEPIAEAIGPAAAPRPAVVRPGDAVRYEAVVTHLDGTPRDVVVNKVLLPGRDGSPGGLLCVLFDVTEFRRAERATREAHDAAAEAARVKAEFVANVSHELRTPLQTILGYAELAQRYLSQPQRLAPMLHDIHDAGRRMLALVEDLLDVAQLQAGAGRFEMAAVDLRGLLRQAVEALDSDLHHRHLRLQLQLPETPLVARVDPARMVQVLHKVLDNAVRYSPAAGRIRVQAGTGADGTVELRIADDGPGIPEGELEAIFDPFVQSSHTKDGSGGKGLGLAIGRKLVQAFGGSITAANAAPGGAVFTIRLPAVAAVAPDRRPAFASL